jgi:hypothetical protein
MHRHEFCVPAIGVSPGCPEFSTHIFVITPIGFENPAYTNSVPNFVAGDAVAKLGHYANELMTQNNR